MESIRTWIEWKNRNSNQNCSNQTDAQLGLDAMLVLQLLIYHLSDDQHCSAFKRYNEGSSLPYCRRRLYNTTVFSHAICVALCMAMDDVLDGWTLWTFPLASLWWVALELCLFLNSLIIQTEIGKGQSSSNNWSELSEKFNNNFCLKKCPV